MRAPFLLTVLLCCLSPAPSVAQGGAFRQGSASPTAASLGRFGDVPVSLYAGLPQIQVPLHDVTARRLHLPVTLAYHPGGLRVDDIPGWVGAGWALNAGGVITRTVRGAPDDGEGGYPQTAHRLWEADGARWHRPGDFPAYVSDLNAEAADAEPDLFLFNAAGRSGRFVYGPDGAVPLDGLRTVPLQPLRFEPRLARDAQGSQWVEAWTLTTEDGTRYVFDALEWTTEQTWTEAVTSAAPRTYVSSWYLTRIESAEGEDQITLTYAPPTPVVHRSRTYRETYDVTASGTCGPLPKVYVDHTYETGVRHLRSIDAAGERLLFETSLREDARHPDPPHDRQEHRLDHIRIEREGHLVRAFAFDYGYFNDDQEAYGYRRLRLDGLWQEGSDGRRLPPHTFAYQDAPALPPRFSDAVDHWGFYNGRDDNTGTIPALYEPGALYLDGADRHPDSLASLSGMLTRITYPTGGHTEFTYESQRYGAVGALPVSRDVAYGPLQDLSAEAAFGASDAVDFSIPPGTEGLLDLTVAVTPPPAAPVDDGCLQCTHARVEILREDGALQRRAGGNGSHSLLLPPGTYRLAAHGGTDVAGAHASGTLRWRTARLVDLTTSPLAGKPAGGPRIRRSRTHDGHDPDRDLVRDYTYRTLIDGRLHDSGVLVSEPHYYQQILIQPSDACAAWYHARASQTILPLGNTQGRTIGYGEVRVDHNEGRDGYAIHTFLSPYHFPDEDQPGDTWPYGRRTSLDWRRGLPDRIEHYDAEGTLRKKERHTYRVRTDPGAHQTYRALSYKVLNRFDGYVLHDPLFHRYRVSSAWIHADELTTTHYDADGLRGVTLTGSYTYGSPEHLQLTRLTETDQDGRQRQTEFRYAHEQPAYAAMGPRGTHHLDALYRRAVLEADGTPVAVEWTCWATDWSEGAGTWRPRSRWQWERSGAPLAADPCRLAVVPPYRDTDSGALLRISYPSDAFDAYGRERRVLGPLGRLLTTTYGGPQDRLLLETALGNHLQRYDYFTEDGRWGMLRSAADPSGGRTHYDYDAFGRLTAVYADEVAPIDSMQTAYRYRYSAGSDNGWRYDPTAPNHVEILSHDDTDATRHLSFTDGLGRTLQEQRLDEANRFIVHAFSYDAEGRLHRQWRPYRWPTGGRFDAEAALHATAFHDSLQGASTLPFTETTYAPSPLAEVRHLDAPHAADEPPPRVTSRHETDGTYRLLTTTAETGRITRTLLSGFNDVLEIVDAVGTEVEAPTRFKYDVSGRLTHTIDQRGHLTRSAYDGIGRRLRLRTPQAEGLLRLRYDAADNLRLVASPRDASSGFLYVDYDEHHRPTERGYCEGQDFDSLPDEDTQCPTAHRRPLHRYTYDAHPDEPTPPVGLGRSYEHGRLARITFTGGAYHYYHDREGRMAALLVTLEGLGAKLLRYRYDLQGRLLHVAYQPDSLDAHHQWYHYDAAGRLVATASGATDDPLDAQTDATYRYTPDGRIASLALGAMAPIPYRYHLRGWLTHINDLTASPSSPFSLRLGYDAGPDAPPGARVRADGTPAWMRWRTPASTEDAGYTFTYDPLGRLAGADFWTFDGGWSATPLHDVGPVTYDLAGNLKTIARTLPDPEGQPASQILQYDYATDSDRLLLVQGSITTTVAHDADGNVTETQGWRFQHGPLQRTLSAERGDTRLLFQYDAAGRRTYKRLERPEGAVDTWYVRGLDGTVLAVYEDDGAAPRWHWNIVAAGRVLGRREP